MTWRGAARAWRACGLGMLLAATACSDGASSSPDTHDAAMDTGAEVAVEVAADATPEVVAGVAPRVEQRGAFTVVWLRGTPYEMGQQQGQLLHEVIADAMQFVADDPLLSALPVLAAKKGLLDLARANSYPQLLDECQGLVDATADVGFSMDFCLSLNFGDVILEFLTHGMPTDDVGPGCSQIVASGDATPDGRLYHGRNLDWGGMNMDFVNRYPVIFVRQPTGEIPHVYVGFPMNLSPYTGLNAAGVSSASNEVHPLGTSEQALTGRSHVQMQARLLATAHTAAEARAFLEAEPSMSCELLVVADGNARDGFVAELTAAHRFFRPLEQGVVFQTNHFASPQMDPFDMPRDPATDDNSLLRFERLSQLVPQGGAETRWGTLAPAGLAGVLRDRHNPRTGVEAPDGTLDDGLGLGTNGLMHQVLFDPAAGLFWVAAGTPPIYQIPWTCFSLGELLQEPEAAPCPAALP